MFGEHPVELGLAGMEDELLQRLRAEPTYQELFPAAFPAEADPFSVLNITRAIASFERTLTLGRLALRSPPGRRPATRLLGERQARRAAVLQRALRVLPLPRRLRLHRLRHHAASRTEEPFHNNALYNIDLEGGYPAEQHRPLRAHWQPQRHGALQGAHAAQHRAHRALHARRQHRHAGPRCSTTTRAGGRTISERTQRGATASTTRSRASSCTAPPADDRARARRLARVPGEPDRRGVPHESQVRDTLGGAP